MISTIQLRDLSNTAFTLIELMVVIVCIAIMGMIVMPSANDEGTRLAWAGRKLIADLEYAQAASIGRGDDPCVVVFDTVNSGYYLARASEPSIPVIHPISGGDYIHHFGVGGTSALNGIEYDAVDVGADDVLKYTATGGLDTGEDAGVTLRCGTQKLRIVIDADTGEPMTP